MSHSDGAQSSAKIECMYDQGRKTAYSGHRKKEVVESVIVAQWERAIKNI